MKMKPKRKAANILVYALIGGIVTPLVGAGFYIVYTLLFVLYGLIGLWVFVLGHLIGAIFGALIALAVNAGDDG